MLLQGFWCEKLLMISNIGMCSSVFSFTNKTNVITILHIGLVMTSRDHWVHKRLYTNEMNDNNTSQHGHCVNRIYRQYTHTFTYTQICAHICYKRHFLRCSANKKIWHLEAIRRAMIFDVDFVINFVKTVTA